MSPMSVDSPKHLALVKGALVTYVVDKPGTPPTVMPFQYNPDTVSWSVRRNDSAGSQESPQDSLRVAGPPSETISLRIRLDAAELKETSNNGDGVSRFGMLPALARLQMLVSPSSDELERARSEASQGHVNPFAFHVPLVLLVLGPNRVVPVKVLDVAAEETLHDARFNPLLVEVSLNLEMLSGRELAAQGIGHLAFRGHVRNREIVAGQPYSSDGTRYVAGVLPQ
ncbi:MAG: hypothetical protein V4510_10555 [bacterium]